MLEYTILYSFSETIIPEVHLDMILKIKKTMPSASAWHFMGASCHMVTCQRTSQDNSGPMYWL